MEWGNGTHRVRLSLQFFFGVIPICKEGILEHGQFIFDNSAGGRIVRMFKLPEFYKFPPSERGYLKEDIEVYVEVGGYNRVLSAGNFAFSLLLNLIRLRWCPGLHIGDDYGWCEDMGHMIWKYGLSGKLADEELDFSTCFHLLSQEYDRRNPPPTPLPPYDSPFPPRPKIKVVDLNILKQP